MRNQINSECLHGVDTYDLLAGTTPFVAKVKAFEYRIRDNLDAVFCPTHLCLGQEGVPDALSRLLQPEDWLFASHRNHGLYLAKGGDEDVLWDEIMGMESGVNKGFSGSQEFSDANRNFHASAIVGGLIGVATGTALALQLNNSEAIVVCCFGDAAAEQGVLWESLNFSALKRLPIVYICENNGMSVDAPLADRQFGSIRDKARGFGVHVCETVQFAVESCRRLHMPMFHEARVTLQCDHLNMATMPVGSGGGL